MKLHKYPRIQNSHDASYKGNIDPTKQLQKKKLN